MWDIIPTSIKELHEVFKKNGKSLFIVGGSVRDFVIGAKIKDFDLATEATPKEVLEILKDYRCTTQGASFFVVVVYTKDQPKGMEIATFREDIYGDKLGETRNPDVIFSTIDKDVFRRDLTCNALFYDLEKKEIIDLVGGIEDIKNKIIKFVGDPVLRIIEDPIRIQRFIRFKNKYEFNFDETSLKAVRDNVEKLLIIKKERRWTEICAAFDNNNFVSYMKDTIDLGVADVIFSDYEINCNVVESCSLEIYFANLFVSNNTEGMLDKMVKEFKMEKDFSRKVVFLLNLIHIIPEHIENFFTKSRGISTEIISEWYKLIGLTESPIHKAFVKYKPTTNAIELMGQGLSGKKLGEKITELEINNFKQLIEYEIFI